MGDLPHSWFRRFRPWVLTLLVGVVLIWGGGALVDWVLPKLIDPRSIQKQIEASIQKETHLQLNIQALTLHPTLFSGVQVFLKNVILRDPQGKRLAKVKQINIRLRYGPLLKGGQKEISQIRLAYPTVYLDPDSYFFRFKFPPVAKKPEVDLKNTTLILTHYQVLANHSLEKHHAYRLLGRRLVLKHFKSNQSLSLKGDGQLSLLTSRVPTGEAIGRFKLKGKVAQAVIESKKLKASFLEELTVELRSLSLQPLRQIAQSYGLRLQPLGPQQIERISLTFRQPPVSTGLPVSTVQAVFHNPDMDAQVKGKLVLREPFEATSVNLVASTSPFPVSYLHSVPKEIPLGVLLQGTSGQLQVNRLQLQGTPAHLKGVIADVGFQQLAVQSLRNLKGRIRFSPDQITLQNLQGFLGDAPLFLQATLSLQHKTIQGRINAQSLSLAQASRLFHQVRPILALPVVLDRFSMEGFVDLDAQMSGSLETPRLNGHMTVRRGALLAKNDPTRPILNAIEGTFHFLGDKIDLPKLSALLNGNRFELSGRYTLPHRTLQAQLRGRQVNLAALQISAQRLSHLWGIPVPALDQVRLAGTSDIRLNLAGRLPNPLLTGAIQLSQGRLVYMPQRVTIENVSGMIAITPTQYDLRPLHGQLGSSGVDIAGKISKDFKAYRVSVTGKGIDIDAVRREVLAKLQPTRALSEQLAGLNGTAALSLVATPGKSGPILNGTVTIEQLAFRQPKLPYPVEIPQLVLHIRDTQNVSVSKTSGRAGPIAFTVAGNLSGKHYDFTLETGTIPVALLREQQSVLKRVAPTLNLPELWNTAGNLTATVRLQPQLVAGTVHFQDAGASWAGGDFPVYHLNGPLEFTMAPLRLHSDQLTFRYGNSDIVTALDYSPTGKLSFSSHGVLSPLVLNHYILPPQSPTHWTAQVPFNLHMAGAVRSFAPGGKGNNLDTQLQFQIAEDTSSAAALQTVGETPGIPQAQVSTAFHLKNDELTLDDTLLQLYNSGALLLKGSIQKLFSPQERAYNFRAVTEPGLDLSKLASTFPQGNLKALSGIITTDLTLQKTGEAEGRAVGFVDLQHLSLPFLEIQDLTGRAILDGLGARLEIGKFQIPGVQVSVRATTENVLETPITFENLQIEGERFNVADFTYFTNEILATRLQQQILNKILGPPAYGAPIVPFQFRDATVALQEVVYQNILLNQYTSRLSLYSNGFFELNDLKFNSTGGNASGSLSMNPQDNNFLSVELNLNNVQANPLAIALLQLPNMIFGSLNGNIRFTTQGMTDVEMINHTNGTASISIKDGRLPTLAKVETLLTAVNILRGGVLGFNLNNLLGTLDPLRTNYFAELSGHFQMVEGIIHTDDLLSDGENLDLLIQGRIRMNDGNADLTITGSMSQTVSGILGPLGKLSVGSLVQYVPGLGYLPGSERPGALGLLRYLPGIGYIPGFGGPSGQQYNRFRIHLTGPLEDPRSVHDLEWLP